MVTISITPAAFTAMGATLISSPDESDMVLAPTHARREDPWDRGRIR